MKRFQGGKRAGTADFEKRHHWCCSVTDGVAVRMGAVIALFAVVVVSGCGSENQYGPHEETIMMIRQYGGKVSHPDYPGSIDLTGTKITDEKLAMLKELSGVRELSLMGCRNVTDAGLEHIKGLHSLSYLALSGTKITDEGLSKLSGMTQLQTLYVAGTEVGDDGLAVLVNFPKLKELAISNTNATDASVEYLAGLKNLHTLYLKGTQISHDKIHELQEVLPNCNIDHEH